MRAALYYSNRDVRLVEMPVPQIGPGELLVRVEACGICGSDVMEWYRIGKAPLVLGHEVAGVIAKVGGGVERYREGERVFVSHHVPCNTCHYCLSGNHTVCDTLRQTRFDPGGFAEYIRIPPINVDRGVFILPEGMSFEEGTFIEPLACVLRGQRIAGMEPGKSIVVIGCGIAGLLHIQLAKASGTGYIVATDRVDFRLKAAQKFGADAVFPTEDNAPYRLRQLNRGHLADIVVVCTGAPAALIQAFQLLERGGTILLFAPTEPGITIPISPYELFFNGTTLTTSYAGSSSDIAIAIELLHFHRVQVKEMITHRLSLAETGLGFQLVAQAQDSLKVIIEPQR